MGLVFLFCFCFCFFVVGVELSTLIRHCFVQAKWPATLAWFVCINKRNQAVESPSHVHRSSANWWNVCFYGVDSSAKETGKEKQTAMR